MPGAQHLSLLRKGRNYVRDAKVPLPDRLQHYNLLQRLGVEQVLTPGFLANVKASEPLATQREVWLSPPSTITRSSTIHRGRSASVLSEFPNTTIP